MPSTQKKKKEVFPKSYYEQNLYTSKDDWSQLLGPVEVQFYSEDDAYKKMLSVANIPDSEDNLRKLKTAELWNCIRSKFPSVDKMAFWENKDKEKKILRSAADKAHALQKALIDISHDITLEKLFDETLIKTGMEACAAIHSMCSDVQKKGSDTENLDKFVFQSALLYEYLSGKPYTSSNSAEKNSLSTYGELFSKEAVEILSHAIKCENESHGASYEACGLGLASEFIDPPRILTTQIKTACVRARNKLDSLRGQ